MDSFMIQSFPKASKISAFGAEALKNRNVRDEAEELDHSAESKEHRL